MTFITIISTIMFLVYGSWPCSILSFRPVALLNPHWSRQELLRAKIKVIWMCAVFGFTVQHITVWKLIRSSTDSQNDLYFRTQWFFYIYSRHGWETFFLRSCLLACVPFSLPIGKQEGSLAQFLAILKHKSSRNFQISVSTTSVNVEKLRSRLIFQLSR